MITGLMRSFLSYVISIYLSYTYVHMYVYGYMQSAFENFTRVLNMAI